MERFRIGYDMTVFWSISDRNEAALPLVDKEVHLYYTCERGRYEADIEISGGNVVVWHFLGKDQRALGTYDLTIEVFQSNGKRTIRKDLCKAFALVGKGCCENTEEGEANINEGGELTLASSLDIYRISPIIPQIGENGNWFVDGVDTGRPAKGEDAYQIAVSRGYDGTYEEYAMLCANIGRAVVSQDVSEILIMRESEYDPEADYGNALIGLKEG